MPKPPHRPSLPYTLFTLLVSPVALLHVIYRTIKDGGRHYFLQRLGLGFPKIYSSSILIHCASVGEVHAAKPLIIELHKQYNDLPIVISTNTPTAASIVTNFRNNKILHVYLPLDYGFAINAFLTGINPVCTLVLETELWPTFYFYCAKKNIPVVIINGRLSNKTLAANQFVKKEYKNTLKNCEMILTRSEVDRANFIALGANENITYTIGNLKYAQMQSRHANLACTTIKRPFFLAVSTHQGEEEQLTEHLALLKKKNYLLVIAPRYPERCTELQTKMQNMGLNVNLHSENDAINHETDVLLIDTIGELDAYFNEAALVFVGGSLIQRGGHNILEPAKYGKCILVGPNMNNFELEMQELLQVNGIIQIANNHELGVQLVRLLNNDYERELYGANAFEFIQKKSCVLRDYMYYVNKVCNKQ